MWRTFAFEPSWMSALRIGPTLRHDTSNLQVLSKASKLSKAHMLAQGSARRALGGGVLVGDHLLPRGTRAPPTRRWPSAAA